MRRMHAWNKPAATSLPLSDREKQFVQRYGRGFSARNMATIMNKSEAQVQAFLPALESPDVAQVSVPPSATGPQAGTSGEQVSLTAEQKAEIRRLGSRGMSPASVAWSLQQSEEAVMGYMKTAEYKDVLLSAGPLFPPHGP